MHACFLEALYQRGRAVGFVFVIAEYSRARHGDAVELVDEHVEFVFETQAGQVSGEQEHVGACWELPERGAQCAARVFTHVEVANCRDTDHVSSSAVCAGPGSSTCNWLCKV